jgi:hypothetical protein
MPRLSPSESNSLGCRRAVVSVSNFGVHVVLRHCGYGNPRHNREGVDGYVIEADYLGKLKYKDERYIWRTTLMQGKLLRKCPCSSKNVATIHYVFEDIISDQHANPNICNAIDRVLSDIWNAIEHAEDHKPRSAIREHLLCAVLRINDVLLPCPIEEYIERGGAFVTSGT